MSRVHVAWLAMAATLAAAAPAVAQQPTGTGTPARRSVDHHGRAVSLGRCDGRPRRRGRHQVGRRRPGRRTF